MANYYSGNFMIKPKIPRVLKIPKQPKEDTEQWGNLRSAAQNRDIDLMDEILDDWRGPDWFEAYTYAYEKARWAPSRIRAGAYREDLVIINTCAYQRRPAASGSMTLHVGLMEDSKTYRYFLPIEYCHTLDPKNQQEEGWSYALPLPDTNLTPEVLKQLKTQIEEDSE